MKHPQNILKGKGSIMEQMGYVCITSFDKQSMGKAYYFEKKHGLCETYEFKK